MNILTRDGHYTDINVRVEEIHNGGMKIIVITDTADGESIAIYDDEIDNLITALTLLKGEIQ